jgi:hypothetical protein
MKNRSIPQLLPLLVLMIAMTVGCNQGPKLAEVTGKVTLNGEPVPNAMITFFPKFQGSPSYGVTDEKGDYFLAFSDTKRGAMIGEFDVQLETRKVSAEEASDDPTKVPPKYVEIPKKYRGKAFSVDVKSGGNTCNFEMVK